jgi:hypothetical protein
MAAENFRRLNCRGRFCAAGEVSGPRARSNPPRPPLAVYNVDDAGGCFPSSRLLSRLGTDTHQICNRTSAVDRFHNLLGASPIPTVPHQDREAILLLFDETRTQLSHRPVFICVVSFPSYLQMNIKCGCGLLLELSNGRAREQQNEK